MSFGGLIAVLMFVVGVLSWEFCCALAMRSAHVVFVVCVGNVQCVCEFGRSCVCQFLVISLSLLVFSSIYFIAIQFN